MIAIEENFDSQNDVLQFLIKFHLNSVEVLNFKNVGKVSYLLCFAKTDWADPFKYISIIQFSQKLNKWSYKEFDESMNPSSYLDCPLSFLEQSDLLSDEAVQWKKLCFNHQKNKTCNKKLMKTKIALLEDKFRSQSKLNLLSEIHGQLEVMNFHSNSKSQIIARNADGAIFRFKLLDISVEEIKKI